MKKQEFTTSQDRKMKFAEAGVLFVLVLALTIFVGVRVATRGGEDIVSPEPVVAAAVTTSETVTPIEMDDPATPVETELPVAADAQPEAIVAEPVEPRVVTYTQAENAYFDRKYEEAADMFNLYTDQHPANAWGFYMLGLSEWKSGDPEAAEEAFAYALEIKPDHVKSLINYGRVLLEQDRQDEAKTQIELALATDPGNTAGLRVHGRIQHNQGLLEEAAASYLTVLRSKEDDAWSLNNLGLIRIQQGRYQEALPALAKAVQIDPEVACFQNNLGVALERTGHFTAASQAYTAAVETDEGHEKADLSLARVAGLTEAEDNMPVDLELFAASFNAATDLEVATVEPAADEEFIVEEEQPAPVREDDETPRN